MSTSAARINLALESLVNLPSSDVVPAVGTRCIELLSHPSSVCVLLLGCDSCLSLSLTSHSPRIRALAMHALQSLAQFTPDLQRALAERRLPRQARRTPNSACGRAVKDLHSKLKLVSTMSPSSLTAERVCHLPVTTSVISDAHHIGCPRRRA